MAKLEKAGFTVDEISHIYELPFKLTLDVRLSVFQFKSFCLRDRGRLGNEGQPILLKIGTQSRYVDLCNMPKF